MLNSNVFFSDLLLTCFMFSTEVKTDGEMLEDGEVNEDAAPKGCYCVSIGCFRYVVSSLEMLLQACWHLGSPSAGYTAC